MSTRVAEAPTTELATGELASELAAQVAGARRRVPRFGSGRRPASLRAGSPAWTWAGVLLTLAGFILLAVGWGQVAGETEVYLQVPYVVSAALGGLALVLVGLTVLNIAARQQDGVARERQIDDLLAAIEDLQEAVASGKSSRR
jgi:hypothetical protein